MFKYEIHLHSSECSRCAMSTSSEMIDAAAEHGYSGVVFTNHFYRGNTNIDRALPWDQFVEAYAEDYENAKAYGKKKNIDVLFGIEEGIGKGKEVLIYGISSDILKSEPELRNMPIDEISAFVHKHNGFMACAHPFRNRSYIEDPFSEFNPDYIDAVEVFNHFNTDDENSKALSYANKYNLPGISGGDIHAASNFGVSGLVFSERITSSELLVKNLKLGNYMLNRDGKISKR